MSTYTTTLARTVMAMRPMVPAKDFEISKRFYIELGFEPNTLADRLVEMQLGAFSFILQAHAGHQTPILHLRCSRFDAVARGEIEAIDVIPPELPLADRRGARSDIENIQYRQSGAVSPEQRATLWACTLSAGAGSYGGP
jgi:hypothetical protein